MGKRKRKRQAAKPKAQREAGQARKQLAVLARMSQASAAWVLGVSSRTLRDSVDAPRLADGDYDLRVLLAWWIEREKKKLPTGPSPARERILEAQAAAIERKNAIEAGKLIDLESVAHTVRWAFGEFMSRLDALAQASTPEQSSALEAAIDQARTQLVTAFPAIAADEALIQAQGPQGDLFNGGPSAGAK